MPVPRRTCPACARRYAGLVAHDCPVCQGLGVLTLGAAALHHYGTAATARAVDLFLEHAAQEATRQLALASRREALEAAADDLRVAGVLASPVDNRHVTPARTPAPQDAQAARVTELDALRLTRELGRPAGVPVLSALAAAPIPLEEARPRDGRPPQASAQGLPSRLATIADPIDPLGPDTGELDIARRRSEHTAAVVARAVPQAAHSRRRAR